MNNESERAIQLELLFPVTFEDLQRCDGLSIKPQDIPSPREERHVRDGAAVAGMNWLKSTARVLPDGTLYIGKEGRRHV